MQLYTQVYYFNAKKKIDTVKPSSKYVLVK